LPLFSNKKEGEMWAPILARALSAAQWLVDRRRQRLERESVPVQLLTDGYFDAMAEDLHVRIGKGQDLRAALRDIYVAQGAVLLRPVPKKSVDKRWMVAGCAAAVAAFALTYRRRR
jgi:hypothetical protein